MRLFKEGDVVKIWSLQSFSGGGFINGKEGIVSQDQLESNTSVLITVERRNEDGKDIVDPSYEVYPQQLKLLKANSGDSTTKEFRMLLIKLKGNNNEGNNS